LANQRGGNRKSSEGVRKRCIEFILNMKRKTGHRRIIKQPGFGKEQVAGHSPSKEGTASRASTVEENNSNIGQPGHWKRGEEKKKFVASLNEVRGEDAEESRLKTQAPSWDRKTPRKTGRCPGKIRGKWGPLLTQGGGAAMKEL